MHNHTNFHQKTAGTKFRINSIIHTMQNILDDRMSINRNNVFLIYLIFIIISGCSSSYKEKLLIDISNYKSSESYMIYNDSMLTTMRNYSYSNPTYLVEGKIELNDDNYELIGYVKQKQTLNPTKAKIIIGIFVDKQDSIIGINTINKKNSIYKIVNRRIDSCEFDGSFKINNWFYRNVRILFVVEDKVIVYDLLKFVEEHYNR